MLIALITDIHGNNLAFEACLVQAASLGAARMVFLGDLVGYGAEPETAVRQVMELAMQGAVVLKGNHDNAVNVPGETMNTYAQCAIEWTRSQLGGEAKSFIAGLALQLREDDRLYVHADASSPRRWRYVTDADAARVSLSATDARITFCGHVHAPALYCLSETGKLTSHRPVSNVGIALTEQRRWLAVIGSAGQPRDGNPAAAYATYDTATRLLTFRRAPYDAEAAAAKIRAAGLPDMLAARLLVGR